MHAQSPLLTIAPFRPDCLTTKNTASVMVLLYPLPHAKLYVPIQLNEELGKIVFKAVHRNPETTIFWHLNKTYTNFTRNFHELALAPPPGSHRLTLDDQGHRLESRFTIIGKTQKTQ